MWKDIADTLVLVSRLLTISLMGTVAYVYMFAPVEHFL